MARVGRKASNEQRATLAVYLSPEALKKLRKIADREYRSASAQARLLLDRALEGIEA